MTKEELLRKRNMSLVKENKELKDRLFETEELLKQVSKNSDEVEDIKRELIKSLDQAHALQDRYRELLQEMQNFKKTVKGRNAIERLVFDLKRK